MNADQVAISDIDVDEFVRTYSRPDGWRGAISFYTSMLREGAEIKALAEAQPLHVPVLAVGAGGGDFTFKTMSSATKDKVESILLDGVGHYVTMEVPDKLAETILAFVGKTDRTKYRPSIVPEATRFWTSCCSIMEALRVQKCGPKII